MSESQAAMSAAHQPVSTLDRRGFAGAYAVPDVALYLRATTPPAGVVLSRWRRSRDRFIAPTTRQLHGWIRRGLSAEQHTEVPARRRVVSFEELVRLRLIMLMLTRGVPLSAVLQAESWTRQLTGGPQPLVTEQIWTYSTAVFVSFAEKLINASSGGQLAMEFLRDFMQPVNHGLEFDGRGVAVAWRPAEGVLMHGRIAFGAPCIEGTRIQTEVLWELHQAGDSVMELAELYGVESQHIEAAIQWEQILARAA
jgi:uncharacterized protein (DUF433 family)